MGRFYMIKYIAAELRYNILLFWRSLLTKRTFSKRISRGYILIISIICLFIFSLGALHGFSEGPYEEPENYIPPIKVKAIAAGYYHTLALREDGSVIAWGRNDSMQCEVPYYLKLKNVTSVFAGEKNSVVLTSNKNRQMIWEWPNAEYFTISENGPMVAWGNLGWSWGMWGTYESLSALSQGSDYTLGLLNDGTVKVFGDNYEYPSIDVPKGLQECTAVAAGGKHKAVLLKNGKVKVWGDNRYGQCNVPENLNNCRAIAAGNNHTVALKEDGTLAAWGDNSFGQCRIPGKLRDVTAIVAGGNFSLALKKDGTVVAWGDNSYGQCKVPSGLTGVVSVTAGQRHVVVLKKDGSLSLWGDNSYSQLEFKSASEKKRVDPASVQKVIYRMEEPFVTINDKTEGTDLKRDVAPVSVEGHPFIPLRSLVEIFGGHIVWVSKTKTVFVNINERYMVVDMVRKTIQINGTDQQLTYKPVLIDGRTMIPVDKYLEAAGLNVTWDGSHTITAERSIKKPYPYTEIKIIKDSAYYVVYQTEKSRNIGEVLGINPEEFIINQFGNSESIYNTIKIFDPLEENISSNLEKDIVIKASLVESTSYSPAAKEDFGYPPEAVFVFVKENNKYVLKKKEIVENKKSSLVCELVDIDSDGKKELVMENYRYGMAGSGVGDITILRYDKGNFSPVFSEQLYYARPKGEGYSYDNNYRFVRNEGNTKLLDIEFEIHISYFDYQAYRKALENGIEPDEPKETYTGKFRYTFNGQKYLSGKPVYDYRKIELN